MNLHKTTPSYVCQTLLASASLHRIWEDALWVCCDPVLPASTAGFKPLPLETPSGICGTGHQQELLQPSVIKQPAHRRSAQLPVPSKAITSQQSDKPATGFSEQGARHLRSAFTSEKRKKKSPPGSHFVTGLKKFMQKPSQRVWL